MESLETVAKQEALSDILKEEYQTLKKDRDVFEKQKQRGNTAIAAAERRKIVEDLKSLFNQDIKTDKGRVALLNIIMLFTIRFIVQLANVFCASMLGVYFRTEKVDTGEKTIKDKVRAIYPDAVCKVRMEHGGKYFIFKNPELHGSLGSGRVPSSAWRNAYENLKGK